MCVNFNIIHLFSTVTFFYTTTNMGESDFNKEITKQLSTKDVFDICVKEGLIEIGKKVSDLRILANFMLSTFFLAI